MNPVLCVTEFNELTTGAIQVASRLAKNWREHVVLLRSVDEREQFPFGLRTSLVQGDWHRLAEEAGRLRALGFEVEEKVLRGEPEDGVAQFAWSSGASLIVVGSTPTGAIDRWALGCLAEEIATRSQVPVLAVRSAAPFNAWLEGAHPLNVFVGIDPVARPQALLNRLDEFRELGRCTVAAGFLPYPEYVHTPSLHAPAGHGDYEFQSEADFRALLEQELVARQTAIEKLALGRDVELALIEHASRAGANLLVITSRPRLDRTLWPPRCLARGILRRAPMSVLCVPETDLEPVHSIAAEPREISRLPCADGEAPRRSHPFPTR